MRVKPVFAWAALWHSKNKLDGVSEHIVCFHGAPALFPDRQGARKFISDNFGYISGRPDLRSEPHGWRVPRAIRVKISPLKP